MYIAERMLLRWHKIRFWILCHGLNTKDLGCRKINEKRHFIWKRLAFLTLIYQIVSKNVIISCIKYFVWSNFLKQREPYRLPLLKLFCVFLHKLAFIALYDMLNDWLRLAKRLIKTRYDSRQIEFSLSIRYF